MRQMDLRGSIRGTMRPPGTPVERPDNYKRRAPPTPRQLALAVIGEANYRRAIAGDTDAIEIIVQATGDEIRKREQLAYKHAGLILEHKRTCALLDRALEAAVPDNPTDAYAKSCNLHQVRVQAMHALAGVGFSAREIGAALQCSYLSVEKHLEKMPEADDA